MTINYVPHEKINLKSSPDFSEVWLHDRIAENTSILGLGELDVVQRERVQQGGGRLDMLLSDPQGETHYEVEIMLGATDPSHIIRCLEYWDIERRRYPGHDHVAVLIAEEVTSRYLNVISLLSGTIPIVAIQVNALKVGDDSLVLDFVKVQDQRALRTDESGNSGGEDVDRSMWEDRVGTKIMGIADDLIDILNETANPAVELKYKKRHLGICTSQSFFNVGVMWPKKSFLAVKFDLDDRESWIAEFENAGLDYTTRKERGVVLRLRKNELKDNKELVTRFLSAAIEESQAG